MKQLFQKGNPGRQKGALCKFTTLKASFLNAFNDKRIGGQEGLIQWILKSEHNRALFYQWITRLLPQEQRHSGEVGHNVQFIMPRPGQNDKSGQ